MWNIPRVGTEIELLKDWAFTLHDERRNVSLLHHLELVKNKDRWAASERNDWGRKTAETFQHTFPAGTKLTVNRVYIRQDAGWGSDDFNSVTFWATLKVGKKEKKFRFWAKLDDVRSMVMKEVKF